MYEVVAGEEKQARKVVAKDKRNTKLSQFGREVVELEVGLHIFLQDNKTQLFDIEAKVIRGQAAIKRPTTGWPTQWTSPQTCQKTFRSYDCTLEPVC